MRVVPAMAGAPILRPRLGPIHVQLPASMEGILTCSECRYDVSARACAGDGEIGVSPLARVKHPSGEGCPITAGTDYIGNVLT